MAEYHIVIRKKQPDGTMDLLVDQWFDSGKEGRGQKVLDSLEELAKTKRDAIFCTYPRCRCGKLDGSPCESLTENG